MASRTTTYFAPWALLPDGWAEGVRLVVDDGTFAEVTPGGSASHAELLPGAVVPGMIDAHAHAFQRDLTVTTQRRGGGDDSFWTWRRTMYDALRTLDADGFETATFARYAALLRGGYTSVVEFHYVHRAPDGSWYPDRNELAHRVVRAAQRAGIGLTLLPVFYAHGDAGGAPPLPEQHRFISDIDGFVQRWDALATRYGPGELRLGIAPHSVRGATPAEIATVVREIRRRDATAPVHVHVSEQPAEVAASIAAYGAPPIAAIDAALPLDERWSLVHATHATDDERHIIARARATVVVCPTTEADLGDGIGPVDAFARAGVRLAIGSDSGVGVDAADELRWLEYGQRLAAGRRNVLATAEHAPATWMWLACASGGAHAAGRDVGRIGAGAAADLIVCAHSGPGALDREVFLRTQNAPRDVIVSGARAV